MRAGTWLRWCPLSVLLSLALVLGPVDARAKDEPQAPGLIDFSSIKVVDVLNLFPNVGALIYFAEPNDFGIPPGIVSQCSGTLIHERAFLVAGHCTAATGGTLLPFIKAFVTFSPNALDRSAWREVSGLAYHPSIPPCPPPDFCTFHGQDPGILDIGLVFLSRPVQHIEPATLARPGTLESKRAGGQLMIVAGYGFLNSLPDGSAPPSSEWEGLRRLKISRLERVVDNEWASWSLPGIVCYGDSGSPTFFDDHPFPSLSRGRVVAVASAATSAFRATTAPVSIHRKRRNGSGRPSRMRSDTHRTESTPTACRRRTVNGSEITISGPISSVAPATVGGVCGAGSGRRRSGRSPRGVRAAVLVSQDVGPCRHDVASV